jgi:prepilin-type processing-associated H-X9-DG protein/prepilin-type N-terminal cleavage/methylation domain-containing protein
MRADIRNPVQRQRTAFTLMELLVVVGIIAVLASLLLPSLLSAKAAGYRAHCQSNLRQLGLALSLYVDDYGVFPSADVFSFAIWKSALSYYLGPGLAPESPGSLLVCPRAGLPEPARTYGYNGLGFGPGQGLFGEPRAHGFDPAKESQVLVPADMIALGDGFSRAAPGQVLAPSDLLLRTEQAVSASPEALRFWAQAAALRHAHRANIAFCDGHVELIFNHKLFLDDSDTALRRWNKDNRSHRLDVLTP